MMLNCTRLRLLLTVMLACVSSGAMAEWTFYGSNKDSDLYLDYGSIRKDGEIAKMWFMEDYRGAKKISYGKSFLSATTLGVYDCKEERVETDSFALYSKEKGGGDVVFTSKMKKMNWEAIVPDSLGEILWKKACGKK